MPEEKKEVEQQSPEQQRDGAMADYFAGKNGDKEPEKAPEPEKKAEGKEDTGVPEKGPEKTDPEPKKEGDKAPESKKPEDVDPHHGSIDSMRKALNDTKSELGRTKNQLNNVLAEVESLKSKLADGTATAKEVKAAEKKADDKLKELKEMAAKAKEDYPELEGFHEKLFGAIEDMATKLGALEGDASTLKEFKTQSEKEREEAAKIAEGRRKFENEIMPEVEKIAPGYTETVFRKDDKGTLWVRNEFIEWLDTKPPLFKKLAIESSNPDDIAYVAKEYMKEKGANGGSASGPESKNKNTGSASHVNTNRSGSRPAHNTERVDENDREGATKKYFADKRAGKG